ncbi:MAG TPA: hypothetical protein VIK18_19540 [Pirellulales bacterium]
MKFVVRCALLAACAVLGVVAAAFIAEHVPAAASGDAKPPARPAVHATAIHAGVMLASIQLQQPAARQADPGRALAEAPLPP